MNRAHLDQRLFLLLVPAVRESESQFIKQHNAPRVVLHAYATQGEHTNTRAMQRGHDILLAKVFVRRLEVQVLLVETLESLAQLFELR